MSTRGAIRILDLEGSPAAVGTAHGTAHRDEIRRYADERVELVASGLWSGGPLTGGEVLELAAACLPAHEAFDRSLHDEMSAMADAAGITPAEAVVVGGFTDFVDMVRAELGGPVPDTLVEDDCTAVVVPDARASGAGFLAQTWDMHDTATDHVVLLRLRPSDAPAALVFTTVGCLGQIGMNEAGVCVGINNLVGLDGARGVTWPSVVRAMLATESADDALAVLLAADLAGAHNYLILDATGTGFDVEAMPSCRPVRELAADALVHTNHVLDPTAAGLEAERAPELRESSTQRLAVATELVDDDDIDADHLMELTRRAPVCQVPVAPYRIESSGAVVMRPRTRDFWAVWGQPRHNEYRKVPMP